MTSLQPLLDSLVSSLSTSSAHGSSLRDLAQKALDESTGKSSAENRKCQWEYLLKNEVFKLAMTEGEALKREDTGYYEELKARLDLVLTFTELDACEQTFPFIVLQDLLETQTINSCSHIFSWIEARSSRLTEGMVPQKGKALILLRTLNDLLRRLSKSGSTTVFCGRILTFLSGVFPLGERSGVNLRGEYGTMWEDVWYSDRENVPMVNGLEAVEEGEQGHAMQVDPEEEDKRLVLPPTPGDKRAEFYNTFWHLQVPFSKPPIFANKDVFLEFKDAISNVIPVIKEATAKERAMMGSRVGAGTGTYKRKREVETEETNANEYFFAKFLTSPDLLDLEIADTHFRRQFLFQLVILLYHLLTFSKSAKANWATTRNRSLQMDFTLEQDDVQWTQETLAKTLDELKQTTPNGRAFAETIQVIMERERNWVKWKNELCAPFDRETWSTERDGKNLGLFEATKELRDKFREPRDDWPHTLGTEPLTEIWQMGYRDLYDLESPFQSGDVKDFVKKIKLEDNRIELRKKALAQILERQAEAAAAAAQAVKMVQEKNEAEASMQVDTPPPAAPPPTTAATSSLHPSLPPRPTTAASVALQTQSSSALAAAPSPTPTSSAQPPPALTVPPAKKVNVVDPQITKLEENKQRWAWLALRTARDQHLQHFHRIGTGDVGLLVQEIEREKLEQERAAEREKAEKVQKLANELVPPTNDDPSPKTPVPESLAGPAPDSEPPTSANGVKPDSDTRMDANPEAA